MQATDCGFDDPGAMFSGKTLKLSAIRVRFVDSYCAVQNHGVVDFPGRSLLILSARSIIIAEFLYSPIGIHRSVSRYVFLMAGEGRINVLSLSG
jgi:hypothetical protein